MTAIRVDLVTRDPTVSARFDVDADVVLLVGPSGAGKSTLLRAVAGLGDATGTIDVGGRRWLDGRVATPARARGAAWLPQEVALFPHLTVRENLGVRGAAASDVEAVASELGLHELLDRPPAALSGGEQQRAGIARTLLAPAEVLLFDEPFSALDDGTAELAAEVLRARARGRLVVMAVHSEARGRLAGVVVVGRRERGGAVFG